MADREQERRRLGWFLAAQNESEHDRKQADADEKRCQRRS